MPNALISLGSNLGDRQQSLTAALARLADCAEIHVVATSRLCATSPVGGPAGQGEFLNGAALVETSLSPSDLLAKLQTIENDFGRKRHSRWDARTLDLDLLLYGDQVIDTSELVVPHPRMTFRRFVLEPAAEIAGELRHPTSGYTISELLENIDRRPRYIAFAGQSHEIKRKLAESLADKCGGILISDPILKDISSLDKAIDQFKRRATLLRESNLDLQQTSISDFWIDELLCDAACQLSAKDTKAFADTVRKRRPEIATPALLMVLGGGDADATSQQTDRFNIQLDAAKLPAVLHLDANDWVTAEQESVAAVLAM